MITFSKKKQGSVILAVTIGNILEWYEIYLYIFWSPIISQLFFDTGSPSANLINTFLLFALGFLARPLGGLFFGRLGDRIGRKKALILSITIMTVPTFLMGLLPTYAQIGIFSPILLGVLRLLQSFPGGGELPGAFCYLYESAEPKRRRFMTSWGSVGNQIGILISILECFLLEKLLSHEDLITWGWRLSFLVGGLIGLFGFCLRSRLHETPLYIDMEKHKTISKAPILSVLNKYKYGIFLGILFCAVDATSFYALSTLFPVYFEKILGTTYSQNLIITILLLLLTTIPLPFLGMLGDKFSNKKMLIASVIGIIILLYPLSYAISQTSLFLIGVIGVFFVLFCTCITALLPYLLTDLFPTNVRFTCVGVSFNIVDSIVGGFTPVTALYLLGYTHKESSFNLIILVSAIISLCSYFYIKNRHRA